MIEFAYLLVVVLPIISALLANYLEGKEDTKVRVAQEKSLLEERVARVTNTSQEENLVASRPIRIRTEEEIQKEIDWQWENKFRKEKGEPLLPMPEEIAWVYSQDENTRLYGPKPEKTVETTSVPKVVATLEPIKEKDGHSKTTEKYGKKRTADEVNQEFNRITTLMGDNGPVVTWSSKKIDETLTGFPLRRAVWENYNVLHTSVGLKLLDRERQFRKYYSKAVREGLITDKQYNELMRDSFKSDNLYRTPSSKRETKERSVREIDGLVLVDSLLVWHVIGSVEHKSLTKEVRDRLKSSSEYRRVVGATIALRGRKPLWRILPITQAVSVTYTDPLENTVHRIFTKTDFKKLLGSITNPTTLMDQVFRKLYTELSTDHPLKVSVMKEDELTEKDIKKLRLSGLSKETDDLKRQVQFLEVEKRALEAEKRVLESQNRVANNLFGHDIYRDAFLHDRNMRLFKRMQEAQRKKTKW